MVKLGDKEGLCEVPCLRSDRSGSDLEYSLIGDVLGRFVILYS
jgi:hypothetical protein